MESDVIHCLERYLERCQFEVSRPLPIHSWSDWVRSGVKQENVMSLKRANQD
jgi:hypothetical protein